MGDRDGGECRIYVGNLPPDVREKEIDDLFYKYGRITNIILKNQKGPPFAFVEFDDSRDADDAVRGRSGYNFDGYKLRVEHPRGDRDRRGGGRFGGGGGGGYRSDRGGGDRDRGGRPPQYNSYSFRHGVPPARRTEHRVVVSGIPSTGSWQDLKDHMREAGDVCYADVSRDGTGVVEFMNRDDMKFAIRHLDDTKFRSHDGDSAYIRVKAEREGSESPRGGSRSRSRSRSPRARGNSNHRSRSRSPYDRRSRSGSPSPRANRRSYSRSPLP